MNAIPKKVLIIEDEAKMLGLLRGAFAKANFATLEASAGKDGLELAISNHPDLIILDLMIPEMDGMTMLTELRRDTWGKHVPVVILTNLSADEGIMQGVIKNEPSYYLVKAETKLEEIIEKAKNIFNEVT